MVDTSEDVDKELLEESPLEEVLRLIESINLELEDGTYEDEDGDGVRG